MISFGQKNKESLMPSVIVLAGFFLVVLIVTYVPGLQSLAMSACSDAVSGVPFAGVIAELLGAVSNPVSAGSIFSGPDYAFWLDIIKSMACIIVCILGEKLVNFMFKRHTNRVFFAFVVYFVVNAVLSLLLDGFVDGMLNISAASVIVSIVAFVVFFAVSAVLICWTNGKEFSSSIFYVIFKVLLSIIGVICTSVFALCIYESIAHKTPALLIVAGVFLIAFCIIKLVIELLLCGKD